MYRITPGLLLLSLSLIVFPVCPTVTETTQTYNCTGKLRYVESEYALKNPDCDQHWSAEERSIGTLLNSMAECHSPCKELSAGKMLLDSCVNVTLSVICSRKHLTEHLIHFYGIMTSQPLKMPELREHTGIILSIIGMVVIFAFLVAGCVYKYCRSNAKTVHSDPV